MNQLHKFTNLLMVRFFSRMWPKAVNKLINQILLSCISSTEHPYMVTNDTGSVVAIATVWRGSEMLFLCFPLSSLSNPLPLCLAQARGMSLVECLVFIFQLSFLTLGKASYMQSIHIKWKVQFVYSALLSANKHTMECRYLTQLLTRYTNLISFPGSLE